MSEQHPFDLVCDRLKAVGIPVRFTNPRKGRSRCPAHKDQRPSLSITKNPENVVIKCHAGCRSADILGHLNLHMANLFVGPKSPKASRVLAVYDYRDPEGAIIAQKVRLYPKAFKWRRPDPGTPDKWIPGLDGLPVGLYYGPQRHVHIPQVFLVEGEKAVDALRAEGLSACCPPSGASRWQSQWTHELQRQECREIIILPDHDCVGVDHARHVAAEMYRLIDVKIVPLPHLSHGEDVVDYLGDGHTTRDLLTLVSTISTWDPGLAARERHTRRKAKTLERVRRWRQRQRQQRVAFGSDWTQDSDTERRFRSCNAVTV